MKIKTACLLLSLCHAGSAAAFGLGEINVRSYLGQPLHATVPLLGAAPGMTADCLSLGASTGSIAPPRRAQLRIEQTGEKLLLHIRTTESVNDPIMQFELVSDCESRLRRDYVVLLDPPAQMASSVALEVPVAAPASMAPVPPAPQHPRRAQPAVAAATPAPAAAHQPVKPRSAKPRTQPAQPDATPRLVLSGKRTTHPDSSPALLRLDTNLPDMNRQLPEGLTAAELSDEYTALTRKLAHLEAQLVDLQQKNTQLEARNAAAAASMPRQPADKPVQWPLFLLVSVLVAGGVALLIAWLRSRSRSYSTDTQLADIWATPDEPTGPVAEPMDADPWAQPLPLHVEKPPAAQRMPEIAPPPPNQSTEVKDDILDQAEVYMAHGHGELAIHLLQEHLRNAPDESPVPWLLLLDLLHRDGNMPGYTAASTECRRYFNINLTSHSISQDADAGSGLEAYPHVLEQLEKVWGTPDTERFFKDLLHDDRGGTRIGFEPAAYRDILLLQAISQNVKPLAV